MQMDQRTRESLTIPARGSDLALLSTSRAFGVHSLRPSVLNISEALGLSMYCSVHTGASTHTVTPSLGSSLTGRSFSNRSNGLCRGAALEAVCKGDYIISLGTGVIASVR